MNKTISLKKVAKYSDARMPIKDVTINNLVTTDNLLQNKLGITKASDIMHHYHLKMVICLPILKMIF